MTRRMVEWHGYILIGGSLGFGLFGRLPFLAAMRPRTTERFGMLLRYENGNVTATSWLASNVGSSKLNVSTAKGGTEG